MAVGGVRDAGRPSPETENDFKGQVQQITLKQLDLVVLDSESVWELW